MTNRLLVLTIALTLVYVTGAVWLVRGHLVSQYQIPGTDRTYPGFTFIWDWWERPQPHSLDDDAEVVAYIASVGAYSLFPHELQERGKWLVRRREVAGRRLMAVSRYNEHNLQYFTPFFAEHSERTRTILVVDNGLLGLWDERPEAKEVVLASLFVWRARLERLWPQWLQYDALGEVRRENIKKVARSEAEPFFRDMIEVDGEKVDGYLQPRLMGDGVEGLRFEALSEPALESLRQFARDGNDVWILSYARSDAVEPRYGQRMSRVRQAVSDFAAQHDGIEHLYYPAMEARFYRDHGHMNPAGSKRFVAWLGEQFAAQERGEPLPGATTAGGTP